ncbi:MAG: Ig-like domain-containing protein [Pirellulales bacterium]
MGRHRSRAWGKNGTNGKASRRTARTLPTRRLVVEVLEGRRLLTASPAMPDLLAISDTGISDTDNLTNLDNRQPANALQFAIGNTIAGATVTLFADGTAIGSAIASGEATTVTTNGARDLADGTHAITARQTVPGEAESTASAALRVTIDTVAPFFVSPVRRGSYDTSGYARGVAVSGTLAYVADTAGGLQIIDASDPAKPVPLSGCDTRGAWGVAISGPRAYVADGVWGLVIIDVSNPAAPAQLGTYDTTGYAQGVAISGTLAYVADETAGLQIIDVSDPSAPLRVGGFDTNGYACGVAVSGTRAYVADGSLGLVIIDVSNPAIPVRLGGYDTSGYARGVAVSGMFAYVADDVGGLEIIDVSNPTAPARSGRYDTGGASYGVAVSGTLAYVADDTAGLEVIDVSNPATPVRLAGLDTPGAARSVAISDSLAYVADYGAGLAVIGMTSHASSPAPRLQPASDTGISNTDNITGDTSPTFDLTVPAGFFFRMYRDGVQISGDSESGATYTTPVQPDGVHDYTVAAVDAAGNVSAASLALSVTIDASIPDAPDVLAVCDTGISSTDNLTNLDNTRPEKALQFAVGNTIAGATVALYSDGTPIGSTVAEGTTTTLTTNGSLDLGYGTHAITARQILPGGFESPSSAALNVTVDTVPPTSLKPVRLGGYDTLGYAMGVAVSGTFAYVADTVAGLAIIDVSNPAAPVRVAGYATRASAYAVAISGTRAFVAEPSAGLEILDVSNPAVPIRLGGYDTSGFADDVEISGTLAYLVGKDGLMILDITNPAAPTLLGRYDTGGFAGDVVISGTRAYVATPFAGLQIVDVSNPASPVRLGEYTTIGLNYGVAASGTLAYVVDRDAGLEILDVSNPAAPVRLGAYDTVGLALGIDVVGMHAYVVDDTAGLEIVDVSNPAAPLWLGGYNTSGSACGVAISGSLAYVADGSAGLQIIDVNPSPYLQPASDTGTSGMDNITADGTPTFNISVPAESYFRVYRDGVQISADFETGDFFTTSLQTDGTYNYSVTTVDAAGNVSSQSPSRSVTIDTRPPVVTSLLVVGVSWTGGFLEDLNAASGRNVSGYAIPVGSGQQLAPLPWSNLDRIKVVFSEDVSIDHADLMLWGVHLGQYDANGSVFTYDPGTFTATWTLASPLAADKLLVRLSAGGIMPIQDASGNCLDGDWTNPATPADTGTDTYPSGNGAAGGDFVFLFRVLPGDANQDGAVDIFDVAKLQVNYGQDHGMMPADGDFDGNGTVDIFDVALLQVAYGRTLDPPAGAPAGAPGAADGEGLLPPVAAQPGRSPTEPSKIAEPLGGSLSGLPAAQTAEADGSGLNDGMASTPARHAVESVKPRRTGTFLLPRSLAVSHAAWQSAVDRALESGLEAWKWTL